jgi:hypothetical protein
MVSGGSFMWTGEEITSDRADLGMIHSLWVMFMTSTSHGIMATRTSQWWDRKIDEWLPTLALCKHKYTMVCKKYANQTYTCIFTLTIPNFTENSWVFIVFTFNISCSLLGLPHEPHVYLYVLYTVHIDTQYTYTINYITICTQELIQYIHNEDDDKSNDTSTRNGNLLFLQTHMYYPWPPRWAIPGCRCLALYTWCQGMGSMGDSSQEKLDLRYENWEILGLDFCSL